MCGIVGYTGKELALSPVLEGLRKLEYRGYDSAGIALITTAGEKLWIEKEIKITENDLNITKKV